MKEHELKYVTQHLGHTVKVHESHYRALSGSIERIEVGKLMMIAENNLTHRFREKELKDIQFEGKSSTLLLLGIFWG